MPPDDVSPFAGFHSYADGRPRTFEDDDDATPMAVRWSPTSTPVDEAAAPEPPADWRRIPVVTATAVGLAAATTFGLNLLQRRGGEPAPVVAAAAPGVQVVVTDPPPAPPVPRRARLEVLPSSPPAPVATPRPAQAPVAIASAAPSSPARATQPNLPSQAALRPAPAPRNAFDSCADAPTPSRRMVCSDMRVAAADQKMKAAYAKALAAGVPHRWLARDQDEWLEMREDAARVSRGAVLNVYRQRTRELQAMAEGR